MCVCVPDATNANTQVNRDTDWGDEDIDMRRKRYRRMKARSRGDDNVSAREGKRHCY